MTSDNENMKVTRTQESGKRKAAGIAGAVIGAGVALWLGVRPIWERNDDLHTLRHIATLSMGASVAVAALNETIINVGDDKGKVRAICGFWATASLAALVMTHGGASGVESEGTKVTSVENSAPLTTDQAVTTLPAPSEAVIVSTVVPETGETIAFVYNNGKPIPAGHCAIDAPISGETTGEQVQVLQTKLNEAGFDAGAVDGEAGEQTSAAVSRLQLAFGMPETLAFDPSTRWGQSDCYQASVMIPAFAGMWVTE